MNRRFNPINSALDIKINRFAFSPLFTMRLRVLLKTDKTILTAACVMHILYTNTAFNAKFNSTINPTTTYGQHIKTSPPTILVRVLS